MRNTLKAALLAATLCISIATVAGCGGSTASSNQGGNTVSGQSGSPTATSSSHAPVTLTPDKQRYAPGDPIFVTIHNGMSRTIWAPDHQTNCTVVLVERLENGAWSGEQNCALMRASRMVPLAAQTTIVQTLGASPGFLADPSGWPAGTYRLTLSYAASDTTITQTSVVHSAEFTVG
jgi:hypothetical protein